MRKVAGVVLALFGLGFGVVLVGLVLWANDQYTVGVSRTGIAGLIALVLVALACVAGSYRLLRGRNSD